MADSYRADAAKVVETLERIGPSTGAELRDAIDLELFRLWRACRLDDRVSWRRIGRRYLRLDRKVDGFGRLSPSTKREFLTYTVLGLAESADETDARADRLIDEVRAISKEKGLLAKHRIRGLIDTQPNPEVWRSDACFLIAGDIVYEMAHAVDRPEKSTGKMVRGSDLDIVVVTKNDLDDARRDALDRAIMTEKHQLLHHPTYREEIDYIIKPFRRIDEQLKFDTFEHKVASKILHEAMFLEGSRDVFDETKARVAAAGVPERLSELEARATAYRDEGDAKLSALAEQPDRDTLFRYFYTKEEEPEIY